MKSALAKRLRRIESTMRISADELPSIFVRIVDASVPDPASGEPVHDFSDQAIVGVTFGEWRGREHRITRRDGESCEAMEERASALSPDTRIFYTCYLNHASLEKFSRATEYMQ